MSVISNTTVLSNFAAIDGLEHLRELFGRVFLSVEVYHEVQRGLEEGYSFYASVEMVLHPPVEDGWLRLTGCDEPELRLYSQTPARLHAGEASCLAIAEHRGWLFLSDDAAARRRARDRNVALSGSLGCLIVGIERGLWNLEQANEWLGTWIRGGFRSPTADLAELL